MERMLLYNLTGRGLAALSDTSVYFVVCDNDFSQIFYNCSNVEEIFT